jgi:adenine-specific DNA-methyltransferase
MLELQKKHQEARMDSDKELFERHIKVVDKQIDRLVYELYGLTEKKVKVVDGAFKMSALREKIFERESEGI